MANISMGAFQTGIKQTSHTLYAIQITVIPICTYILERACSISNKAIEYVAKQARFDKLFRLKSGQFQGRCSYDISSK